MAEAGRGKVAPAVTEDRATQGCDPSAGDGPKLAGGGNTSPGDNLQRASPLTLNFFNKHSESDGKRYDAVNCVRMWLAGKNHLPKDLLRLLKYLVPELAQDDAAGDDFS